MSERPCRLPELISAMPHKADSVIFCHRDGKLAGVPYPECHRDATILAAALRDRGILPGHRVAIHGATSYEWVLADLACLLTGAISVALYPSAPLSRAIMAAREGGCRIVLTDRVDSVRAFSEASLEAILLDADDSVPGASSVAGILHAGAGDPGGFQPADRKSEPFTIVSTSGTLSEPKLFAVHSSSLLYTMDRFAGIYGISGQDRLLLYLPLSHLPQRMMLYWGLGAGMDFILSSPAHMAADTAELSPTLHVAVPRSLEALRGRAMRLARGDREEGARALRSVFGPAVKSIFVGSAACDPAVLGDLADAGLNVYEVYGTTELGMVGLNTPGACRIGTVGRAIPWGNVRIDPANDEILVQTPTPFLYGRLAGGEIEVADREPGAWERTGDVGTLDADGYLTVRGRLRDFLALPNGEKVFVRPLEDNLVNATGASLCVISQDGPELRALLFFEPAEASAVPDRGSFEEPETVANVRAQVAEFNRSLHPWERIRSFSIVGRMPSIAEGTLTETTKIRRHKIEEVYARQAAWHRVREG